MFTYKSITYWMNDLIELNIFWVNLLSTSVTTGERAVIWFHFTYFVPLLMVRQLHALLNDNNTHRSIGMSQMEEKRMLLTLIKGQKLTTQPNQLQIRYTLSRSPIHTNCCYKAVEGNKIWCRIYSTFVISVCHVEVGSFRLVSFVLFLQKLDVGLRGWLLCLTHQEDILG